MRFLSAHYIFPVSSPPLRNGIVCISDAGEVIDVIDTGGKLEEGEKIEFYNGILTPGFVNAHCHLELSHLRNQIEQHKGLPEFLSAIGQIRPADENLILEAAEKAEDEMLRKGIVAVGDISNQITCLTIKRNSRLRYHTFIELFGLQENHAETIMQKAQRIEQAYHEAGFAASIAPHAMYSVSDALFALLGKYYIEYPAIVSMHHQESEEETSLYPQGKGYLADAFRKGGLLQERSDSRDLLVKKAEQCLSLAKQCLLVHNTFTSPDDFRQRSQHLKKIFWVLCPLSNLYIQDYLPDFSLFSDHPADVCLGTDSLASNTCLSILEEMKVIHQHLPDISLQQLLQWATLNGAKALDMDKCLGSIEKNKKPGINLITGIDFERMHLNINSKVKVLA